MVYMGYYAEISNVFHLMDVPGGILETGGGVLKMFGPKNLINQDSLHNQGMRENYRRCPAGSAPLGGIKKNPCGAYS
jgi:hypothetical protein